jgi:integrase
VAAIDSEAIVALMRDLEREGLHAIDAKRPVRPLGYSSIVNYLLPAQGILRRAVKRKLVTSNPFADLESDDRPQRVEKPAHEWSDAEVTALIEASKRVASRPAARFDYSPILRLTAQLGLRLGEVLGLQWRDFDKDEGVLYVRRQWTRYGEYGPPKTEAGIRRIPLPVETREGLIALRLASDYSLEDHPIFASQKGTPLTHRNVTRRGFEEAAWEAGLEGVTFHSLRKAVTSRLVHRRLDGVKVAAVLGHKDAVTTYKQYASVYNRGEADEETRLALA